MKRAVALAFALCTLGVRARADAADAPLLDRVNAGAHETRADGTLLWPGRWFGISRRMDWSAYDFVEVTLFNPGARAIPFSFEVKDADSRDYWTRANVSEVAAPGLQTIRLSTRLRAGELARPGRPLDPARIVSLILSRPDPDDRAPLEVRRIELAKSAVSYAPGLLALHAGPADAGAVDGFLTLDENADYSRARGWGWLEKKFWSPYPQVNRVVAPDALTSSNLAIASAKLRVDLKPGTYRVWMIIDHPGGYWGEYPYYKRRTVRAQGKLVLDERMTPEQAKAEYFRWQDAEDRESDDLFDKYWSKIVREKTFDVRVDGDHLDLAFANEGCPDSLPCFGLALSALAVYPIDNAEQRARGDDWLARLRAGRHAEFLSRHQLTERSLTNLLAALPPGLGVWDAPANRDLSRATAADLHPLGADPAATPRVTTFRNARGYFAPAVSWKGSAARKITWRVTGLPDGVRAEGGWIQYRALRETDGGNLYAVRERWVSGERTRTFAREDLGRLWLRFGVAADARPGVFPATLTLSSGGTQRDARVRFELRVLKARAADLDFPVGPFYDDVAEDWWDAAYLRPRLVRLEQKSLLKMRALGVTAFSFRPKIRLNTDRGVAVDANEIDRVMSEAKRLGFLGLVGYDDVFSRENLCEKAAPDDPLARADVWRRTFDGLEAKAKQNSWLPLALIVCDEPVGDRAGALLDRLQELPAPDPRRRVQWSVTTSLGREATPQARELARRVSLPFLAGFAPEEIRFPWAFYNAPSRDSLGLGMYRLRKTTDLRYRLLWTWNANSANPYFDFDGRESDYAWCSSKEDESLRCSVGFDREIDRGLTDYRIALGLERLLDERKDLSPEQAARGQAILEEARTNGVDPEAWLAKAAAFEEDL